MSFRTVYGNDWSEAGWRMCNRDECDLVRIPGLTLVDTAPLRKGPPLIILGAWLFWYDRNVEEITSSVWGWSETNAVGNSNHLSGTAVDINAPKYPWGARVMPADRIAKIREGQRLFEGSVFWGEDWNRADQMHHQMHWEESDSRNAAFAQKLLGGYLGIYGQPAPLSKSDGYSVLIIQEGQRRGITPRGIQIALATGLVESSILVYANAKVPASMNIPHDAVGSDGYSVGIFQQQVRDSGNGWWWGDAATCMDPTSSAGLFYDRLAKLDYNNVANSPGSYAQAVQSSAFPDRYDQRWGDATDIYNRLATTAPPTQGEDDLSAKAEQMIADIHRELTQRLPSRSPLRHLDQTQYYQDGLVDTVAGFTLNVDGMTHVQYVQALASYGHPPTLALLREVASAAGDSRYPDRQDDAKLAQAILADVTSAPATTPALASAATTTGPSNAELEAGYRIQALQAELDSLRAENARLQAAVSTPPAPTPLPAVVEPTVPAMTSGDHAGKVIDSVEDWTQHILAMDTPQRAAFVTSMKALELPNGSQL